MGDSPRALLDRPSFHWLQVAAAASAAVWAVIAAAEGQIAEAAALAAVAVLGLALVATPNRLPSLFRFALLAVAYINAAGYVLNLWIQQSPFDEIVHCLTSFAATATVAWLLLSRTPLIKRSEAAKLVAVATAVGIVLGVAWEAFEWAIGIIGDRRDTIVDLVMDSIGALAAGLFCAWAAALRQPGTA